MGVGGDDVKTLYLIIANIALLGMAACVVTAFFAGSQAVRIGGTRLLFNGIAWFAPPPGLPPEARPHMRRALLRWLGAMGCMVIAAIGFGLARTLP